MLCNRSREQNTNISLQAPKGDRKTFLETIIEIIKPYKHKEINIIGDFNIDLTSENYENLIEEGLLPTIHKYTR